MKTLSTILFFFVVTFASAQVNQETVTNDVEIVVNEIEVTNATDVAISTKGVKKLEDIKIETINKTTYLGLMLSTKKNKNIKTC